MRKQVISNVLEDTIRIYNHAGEEFRSYFSWEWENARDAFIQGEIELFSDRVRGYAGRIIAGTHQLDFAEVRNALERDHIFNNENFVKWYTNPEMDYPTIKRYVHLIDYIRCLILQHLDEQNP